MRIRLPAPLSVSGDSWEDQPAAYRQRALVGALLLRIVLRRLLGGGGGPGRELIEELLASRYRPLLEVGELTAPADAKEGLRGLEDALHAELQSGGGWMSAVEAYSSHVTPLLGSLKSHPSLWLANYIEYVALNSSPLDAVGLFLESTGAAL